MKYRFIEALKKGQIVKNQAFDTDKGTYKVTLIRYKNDIYFFKYLNDKVVECCNLSRAKTRVIPEVKNDTQV